MGSGGLPSPHWVIVSVLWRAAVFETFQADICCHALKATFGCPFGWKNVEVIAVVCHVCFIQIQEKHKSGETTALS